jgi:hypothetical protein
MTNEHIRMLRIPVGVNVLLGVPAVVPLFLAWYIMVNGPLAAIGWTQRDPNENDGMLLWLVIAVPVFCLFGLIWGLANAWMRRRTAVPAHQYWIAAVVASLVPYFVGLILL